MNEKEMKFREAVNNVMEEIPDIIGVKINDLDVTIEVITLSGKHRWNALIKFQDRGNDGYSYLVDRASPRNNVTWLFGSMVIKKLNE